MPASVAPPSVEEAQFVEIVDAEEQVGSDLESFPLFDQSAVREFLEKSLGKWYDPGLLEYIESLFPQGVAMVWQTRDDLVLHKPERQEYVFRMVGSGCAVYIRSTNGFLSDGDRRPSWNVGLSILSPGTVGHRCPNVDIAWSAMGENECPVVGMRRYPSGIPRDDSKVRLYNAAPEQVEYLGNIHRRSSNFYNDS